MQDQKDIFPATVAEIISKNKIVINRGEMDGILNNQRFLIYELSKEEILDPETKEPLGFLEIVKGSGRVIHVQEKMAIIESDRTKTITKKQQGVTFFPKQEEYEEIPLPFDYPKIGDKAKPL